MPTVLPTVGRRAPAKKTGLGPLRPTVGNTVGITTPLSVRYPINLRGDLLAGGEEHERAGPPLERKTKKDLHIRFTTRPISPS